jgi:starvation-inducible DNA-binding protein
MSEWNGFRIVESKKKEEVKEETPQNNLAGALKKVLANAYVLYHTIHGFHWNVKGTDFYEYHKLFDEIVDDIYDHIDPIAENIVKLSDVAPFVMSQLSGMASIKEVGLFSKDAKELTQKFREMNLEYIEQLKLTFNVANKENEQGVANFIAERIDQHQKWDWFLKASLGE